MGQRGPVGRGPTYLEHPCNHDFHREDIAGDDHELALLCLLGLEIDLNRCGNVWTLCEYSQVAAGDDHEIALLCLQVLEINLEEGGGRCVEA